QRRRQVCYRSDTLLGDYERKIIFDDDFGYHNKGIAQGALFDTPNHKWYAMLFQDHDAVGRIPYILPVEWKDGWPMIGDKNGKVPEKLEIGHEEAESTPLVISDDFEYEENKLALNWQWNHNPHHELWSLTERPGYLRLTTGYIVNSILAAQNTLTQCIEGHECSADILLDLTGMKDGDRAGIVALQSNFGTVGIKQQSGGKRFLIVTNNDGNGNEKIVEEIPFSQNQIHLKIRFNFENSTDLATFYYADKHSEWTNIGPPLQMKYTLDHFMGYRIGLYNYATKETGGHVDFHHFHYNKEAIK